VRGAEQLLVRKWEQSVDSLLWGSAPRRPDAAAAAAHLLAHLTDRRRRVLPVLGAASAGRAWLPAMLVKCLDKVGGPRAAAAAARPPRP
jgi:hypothetical protein